MAKKQPRPIRVFSVGKPILTPTLSRMTAKVLLAELRRMAELAAVTLILATPAVVAAYWLVGTLQQRGW